MAEKKVSLSLNSNWQDSPRKASKPFFFFCLLFIAFMLQADLKAEHKTSPVSVKLVTEKNPIVRSDYFRLGVYFEIQPGWHIYWQNPGEAGLATRLNLKISEIPDFKDEAHDWHWPIPKQFSQTGDIIGYGYEREALIWRELKISENPLLAAKSLTFKTEIKWLACKDICVPGKADLSVSVPFAAQSKSTDFSEKFVSLSENSIKDIKEAKNGPTAIINRIEGTIDQEKIEIIWNKAPSGVRCVPGPQVKVKRLNCNTSGITTFLATNSDLSPGQEIILVVAFPGAEGETAIRLVL